MITSFLNNFKFKEKMAFTRKDNVKKIKWY